MKLISVKQGLTKQIGNYLQLVKKPKHLTIVVRKTTIISSKLKKSGVRIKFFPW